MKIRSTEREHAFTNRLFQHLSLFSLQGLTINASGEFSAAIEAIQYEDNEKVDFNAIFRLIDVKAKYYLASQLNIPLYFVIFQHGSFYIYQISVSDDQINAALKQTLNEEGFVNWWAFHKGTQQVKPLYEATSRVARSIFDLTLERHGLKWGGNIDGYMFAQKRFACIIENIYTQTHPLESSWGEPSPYFKGKGPNYTTWLATVKLASQLNVPLFLFTIEGNSDRDRIGFTIIDHLSPDGIFYVNDITPNNNILEGLDTIKSVVYQNLNAKPPQLIANGIEQMQEVRKLQWLEDVPEEEKYVSYFPLYTIQAACGRFGDLEPVEQLGWMPVSGRTSMDRTLFIVQAQGRSMEDRIHDGDYCLFRHYAGGFRSDKIVLAEQFGETDEAYEGSYTIKQYRSTKSYSEDGSWQHEKIILHSLNRQYDDIILTPETADEFRIIGEFVDVIK